MIIEQNGNVKRDILIFLLFKGEPQLSQFKNTIDIYTYITMEISMLNIFKFWVDEGIRLLHEFLALYS